MKNLRRGFERFCFKHKNIGIPNLMLFIGIGTALVYLVSRFANTGILYYVLCFNREAILKGQVWRLFTYVFIDGIYPDGTFDNILSVAIGLICYYSLGKAMENTWGTLRFNLYYFSGIILTTAYCMIFGGYADVYYLNLSLFLGYATLYPDTQFLLLFIIPIKGWILAVFNLVMMLIGVLLGHSLLPIVALANYFLFFGKDVVNVFPLSWRANASRLFRKKKKKTSGPKVIPFPDAGSYQASAAKVKAPYTHCCTVCGRTDVSNPELEFRYCSRCSGYRCYCQDHIGNHTHE